MKRFGREIALLTLPVLIFGGLALWKTRGGSMAQLQGAPSDIYSGKPRLEIGEIKPLELTPWDVAQGFVWGIDATVWQGGQSPVAAGAKRATTFMGAFKADVFYRRGSQWTKAKRGRERALIVSSSKQKEFGNFAVRRDLTLKVNLKNVPRDADEVRLRGHFFYENDYQNGGCRGVLPGPGWRIFNRTGVCYFTTQSKPFDIPVVKKKGEWPNPNVSRETALELVDAKFLVDSNTERFVLQIRRKDSSDWTQKIVDVQNVQILDADKRLLELIDSRNGAKTKIYHFGTFGQEQFSPQRANSDLFAMVVPPVVQAPKNGWSSVKFPLTLRAEVSDGTCWPLKIDTKVERVQMRTEDFGAAK